MTKPQQQRYLDYMRDTREDKKCYYSNNDITLFNKYDNKLSILFNKIDNVFEKQDIMKHYFNEEYVNNIYTFGVYLFLNYKNTQTSLTEILNNMNVNICHYETAESFCLGLTVLLQTQKGYEYFYASFTNGLEIVDINV